ncbi:rhomboid family intramembrane serine protease [Calycomorphotria hydatis]|uniref:Rhomboid protease GluP n=1 Tax=Calycomorphotria hydatis TaxID=2528027 RepID=A0A517T769_9PLAN|nr:rhomboid family intramembrane serine protease [Calycomorphotria hydatis]QDT64223.1 Rhomboid protease GluP [Calycomorphotria hydatis]
MGIYDRDYTRDYNDHGPSFFSTDQVTKTLMAITIGVFIAQLFTFDPARGSSIVTDWLSLSATDVLKGQVWRLITFGFCHSTSQPFHILFNMLWLWWFGRMVESMYGEREFLMFYLAAIFASGLCAIGVDLAVDRTVYTIGASGAVMGIVILYALHYPRQPIHLLLLPPIELRWVAIFIVVTSFFPLLFLFAGSGGEGGVSHSAHFGGILFSYFYYRNAWRLAPMLNFFQGFKMSLPKRRHKAPLKIHDPDANDTTSDLDDEVDSLLAKIHEHGEGSLTDAERRTLEEASRRLRGK